jgi:methyl-accepting chemotaxis protein
VPEQLGAVAGASWEESAEAAKLVESGIVAPDIRQLAQRVHEFTGSARLEAFALDETVAQMNQVAFLIVDNRGEAQGAWAASRQLEETARELGKLVKYFE